MLPAYRKDEIRPLVAKTYPLKDIVAAQKDFLAKKFVGKLVLITDGGCNAVDGPKNKQDVSLFLAAALSWF
jgi:hypothetical protein